VQLAEISTLVTRAATRFGDRVALTLPESKSFTFNEIDDLAGRFAGGLKRLGIDRGDRVTLHLPNGWEWIVAYHAIARLGAVVVPANILLSGEEVAHAVTNSGSSALIVLAEKRDGIATAPNVQIVTLGAATGSVDFPELLSGRYEEPVPVSPDDLFTIGYTSGTTGSPKGAMLSHGNIHASMVATATLHVRHGGDVALSALPFSHVYGNIVMNTVFLCGMRLVARARFDAGEILRLIAQERITLFEGVPTMYYQMLAHPHISTADLSSLVRCTVGGQTMPTPKIDAVEGRFGCPLLELWGMTEVAGPAVTHSPYWSPRRGSIGLPVPGVEVRITDLDNASHNLPAGEAGELMVRGPLVTRGYWNNPQASAEAIDSDGWLATGDIARADADGFLFIVDRKKDLIITAGYNVYPAELEQIIAMHPAVAMVAVTSVADDEKGEIAWAVVVRHVDADVSEAELLTYCRQRLASYKVPRLITFADDLPKTNTGKILRRALRQEVPQKTQ
jgi:long-chain acyl-CoA synthetase